MLLLTVILVAMMYTVYRNGIGKGVNIGRLQILEENSIRAEVGDLEFVNSMNDTINTVG